MVRVRGASPSQIPGRSSLPAVLRLRCGMRAVGDSSISAMGNRLRPGTSRRSRSRVMEPRWRLADSTDCSGSGTSAPHDSAIEPRPTLARCSRSPLPRTGSTSSPVGAPSSVMATAPPATASLFGCGRWRLNDPLPPIDLPDADNPLPLSFLGGDRLLVLSIRVAHNQERLGFFHRHVLWFSFVNLPPREGDMLAIWRPAVRLDLTVERQIGDRG